MKTKFNLKTLLVVAILLIMMCVFNTNVVQATDVKANETKTTTQTKADDNSKTDTTKPTATTKTAPNKDTLKLIPDTINVKQKESQFEELFESGKKDVETSIKDVLSKANIDMTNYEIVFDLATNVGAYADIHKATIFLQEKGNYSTELSKDVTIVYSNSSSYNENDEKAAEKVASIVTDPWHTFGFDETMPESIDEIFKNDMKTWINDKTVTYKITSGIGEGGSGLWTYDKSFNLFFFKNDKCYASKSICFTVGRELIIPENIRDTEEDYINYALPIIKQQLAKESVNFTKLELLKNDDSQWYTVRKDEDISLDTILIKKANTFKVYDGITIASNANVTLSAETIKKDSSAYTEMQKLAKGKGYTNIFNAYELKLAEGKIEKDGLTLTFDVGTKNNGKQAIVLHKKQNGTTEEFVKTVENGRISITVNELSPFMIALKDKSVTTTANNTNKKLDNDPKMRCLRLYNICKCYCSYFIRWIGNTKI